ncbi:MULTISPECIES: hypothetical protein [Pseudomonas]|uniref:hypothetical protein n=1 Tax=Pseudomonas TaxID=286 RepID=UPI001AE7A6FC|nr:MULTISPECIES: hypothetical protein [unclassified Pseudomonas]MBP1123918.1 hypothetical protein [Pseudomonas sp. PvP025]MDQ0397778.1 hypothetical protein [Pseudomonas sp. PvP006]
MGHEINVDKFHEKLQDKFHAGNPCQGSMPNRGERACPALGCEAPPIEQNAVYLILRGDWFWGCCAAQRRASLLATTSRLATGNLRFIERHLGKPA